MCLTKLLESALIENYQFISSLISMVNIFSLRKRFQEMHDNDLLVFKAICLAIAKIIET